MLHTCGDVRALLPMMRRSGIDAIDSLSEPPLGNTPFEVAMAELGDGVCLIGGVSPIVLANGTPDDVRAHVLDLFRPRPFRPQPAPLHQRRDGLRDTGGESARRLEARARGIPWDDV